jgi:tetratricopeptide (TPR) repeat protein
LSILTYLKSIAIVFLLCSNLYAQGTEELLQQGTTLIKNSNYSLAVTKLEECVRIDPENIGCHCNLAAAYGNNGELDKAIETIEKVIDKEPVPSRGILFYNLGNLYKEKRDIEKAKANFFLSLKLMPFFSQSYGALGAIYMEKNEREEATEYFKKSVSIDSYMPDIRPLPDSTDNLGYTTVFLSKNTQNKPALYLYQSPAWYVSLAINYMNQNRISDALKELDKASVVFDKDSPLESDRRAFAEVHVYKGSIFLMKKDLDEAFKEYDAAYNIDNTQTTAIAALAYIYYLKGNLGLADQFCKLALYYNPESPVALDLKKRLLQRKDR